MPGLAGLITNLPRQRAEEQLLRMLAPLRHESFYETGTWIDESLGVYVGWVARKSPFSGRIPLENEKGDVVLIFSGEDFPDPGTIPGLKARGHAVDGEGPSYLVHLCEEDPEFPASLNGRFQGLLIDRRLGRVALFNDRYGMHRIYYHQSDEAFYFSAEAKAILLARPELRRLNNQSLGEYLSCGCVLENRTLFEGVQTLPPGARWVFRQGALEAKGSYFEPAAWEAQPQLGPEDFYHALRDVFSRNLSRYFSGPEQIGMSLTGGLDSRLILAWDKRQPGTMPCYSFGGAFRDNQDVILARKVAAICHQPHEVIEVGTKFISQFPHYAERAVYLTDGCTSVERSADLYINERAREIAPARMTGNYGSEVLRRMRAFRPSMPAAELFQPELMTHIQAASQTYARQVECHPLSFAVFRQAPWHHFGLLALEETQVSMRSPFLDNELVQTVYRAPESACLDSEVCLRLIAEGDSALSKLRTDRGVGGQQTGLARAATQRLIEFTIKAEYAYDYGMPQWVAKVDHLVAPLHLERLFLGRHRFSHFRIWYRDALSGYVRDMLLDSRSLNRPHIDRKGVESIVSGHLKGNRNYTAEIHQLLTIELLHRLFLDSK